MLNVWAKPNVNLGHMHPPKKFIGLILNIITILISHQPKFISTTKHTIKLHIPTFYWNLCLLDQIEI
jgi:hypothetical protein